MEKYIRYKGELVHKNTELYSLLEKGETNKAEALFSKLNKDFNKYWPEELKYLQNWCINND